MTWMSRRMLRRWFALIVALAILAIVPTTASAGKPFRETDHAISVYCDGMAATSGRGFVFFGAFLSDTYGPDAFVDYWPTDEPSGQPTLTRDYEQPVTIDWDGTTFAGTIPLVTDSGTPAGDATFTATLVPTGEPFSDSFTDQFGNHRSTTSFTIQPLAVTDGVLQLPNRASFSLVGCFADETSSESFSTNPNAFVERFSSRNVDCPLTNEAGDEAFLFVGLGSDELFVDAFVQPADGSGEIAAFGFGTEAGGVVEATLETYDPNTGEPLGGGGAISMTLASAGEPIRYIVRGGSFREMVRGQILDVSGTLEVDGRTFDLSACVLADTTSKFIGTLPQGPKPGGKTPANDLPSGAKTMKVGSGTTIATKGASPDREAPYDCLTFVDETGEIFEVPVGYTVWYKIAGTGSAVTFDTAGSDFDTVAAVYAAPAMTPVACVDDVRLEPIGFSLQSSVTFATTAGTTYYVQIGGFPDSFPYGTLKLAVR